MAGPASAPVTEMMMLFFPASFSNSELDGPYKAFAELVNTKSPAVSISSGWVVEEQQHASLGDAKGKAFVIAVGWESVESYSAYQETSEFKDAIAPVRDLSSAVNVWHVKNNKY
jgi:heme-degrading monooxygenase HmoA